MQLPEQTFPNPFPGNVSARIERTDAPTHRLIAALTYRRRDGGIGDAERRTEQTDCPAGDSFQGIACLFQLVRYLLPASEREKTCMTKGMGTYGMPFLHHTPHQSGTPFRLFSYQEKSRPDVMPRQNIQHPRRHGFLRSVVKRDGYLLGRALSSAKCLYIHFAVYKERSVIAKSQQQHGGNKQYADDYRHCNTIILGSLPKYSL